MIMQSGPGSLAQEVALAGSGGTIISSPPAWQAQTIHLTTPLVFHGNMTFDGSRASGLSIVDSSGVAIR